MDEAGEVGVGLEAVAMPRRLPAAFARYEGDPGQMAAGAPGKRGLLRLGFERRDGRTRLLSLYGSGPQRVQRALYLDPGLPDMAFAVIQSVSGGVLQGDRLALQVVVGAGAQAHVTTQSATKVYRMDTNYATVCQHVQVEPGAYLEFLPDYLIPYRQARFHQEIELVVADDATLLFCDALAPGRVAFGGGELFAYDIVSSRVGATDAGGRVRFNDATLIEPARLDPRRAGLLGEHTHVANFYVVSARADLAKLVSTTSRYLASLPGVVGGTSLLPAEDGVVARITAASSSAIQVALFAAWRAARSVIVGVDLPRLHTIKYGLEPASGTGRPSTSTSAPSSAPRGGMS